MLLCSDVRTVFGLACISMIILLTRAIKKHFLSVLYQS